jgi:hypothetical protein
MSSKHFAVSIGAILNLMALSCLVCGETQPASKADERTFRFEGVGMHERLEHTFAFENTGSDLLQVGKVSLSPPLECVKVTSKVSPGETGRVTIRLGEPRKKGDYEGQVELAFKNPGMSNLLFHVAGKIAPVIECVPMSAFFVSTQRGEPKRASIQIFNREKEPLEILRVEHASSRFTTELETVQAGQRYALTLSLKADGKPGRLTEPITLVTSSKKEPAVKIQANTLIKERVYTFPDTLDFGLIRIQDLKSRPQLEEWLAQNLMVYQNGGKDFRITARTDVPFLKLAPEASKLQDRYEIKVEVIPEKLKPGRIDSSIAIETNDPEFSSLEIPVKIVVE